MITFSQQKDVAADDMQLGVLNKTAQLFRNKSEKGGGFILHRNVSIVLDFWSEEEWSTCPLVLLAWGTTHRLEVRALRHCLVQEWARPCLTIWIRLRLFPTAKQSSSYQLCQEIEAASGSPRAPSHH